MKRTLILFSLVLAGLLCLAGPGLAQTQTGIVQGRVVDQQGGVLPGVSVELVGPQGTRSAVTDAEGGFRFVGVAPGTYSLKTNLSGFLPQLREGLIVSLGRVTSEDFALKVGGLSETVEVSASALNVDVKSSSTDTNLSNALLTSMPIYSATSAGLLNYAPGINGDSAYGATSGYGSALLLDGVDTRDPAGGSAWTFFNQNLIQEIQIGGLGAAAEHGGFTGGIINTITKSGGNLFSGLFSIRYTNDSLASNNISADIAKQNPSLTEASVTKKLVDYTVQMGGPIKKDKVFFFGSVQRYSTKQDPSGPRTSRTDVSPRFNFKFTFQPTPSDTVIFGMQYDQYNVTGRVGWWPTNQATDKATVTEDAPEWVWNAQYRKVFGSSTFLEAKFTGYTGFYYLDPVDPSAPVYDGETNEYSGGGGGLYYADRSRNQVIASLTKFAQAYGSHAFKFGAEFERSHVRSQYQPYGPGGFYNYTYGGVPYYRYTYGYDLEADNRRTSLYAQDQWNIKRLTLNLGLRMDHIRGYSPRLKENVYTPHAAWGPRLGAAIDVTGNGTTVLRAFWGRYFEGTAAAMFEFATPGVQDYTSTPLNPDFSVAGPPEVLTPGQVYGISKDINHPRTDEFSVGWEQQLLGTMRLVASGIWRSTTNNINNVIDGALWQPFAATNPLTNQPYTLYKWANKAATSENFYIRNVQDFQYKAPDGSVISTVDARRKYKALMLMLSRPLKGNWGFQASYVLSKAEGNINNDGWGSWLTGSAWMSPNTGYINNYGELTYSPRHEFKLYFTYLIPKIEVMLSPQYFGVSGNPYTPYYQYGSSTINIPGSSRRRVLLEPRGTERNDFYNEVDLRVEKVFLVQGHRFGVYADIGNLFNTASIDGRVSTYPSTTISGYTVPYKGPSSVQDARQISFGARWSF
jgi:hypothetical protein